MKYKALIIGGSAGSFQVILKIISNLPKNFALPVFLSLHRLKHVRSGFVEALLTKSILPIKEPFDKEQIKPGTIYLAPANYHMYMELGGRISLSTEPVVNHSRPSIDLSFFSAANVYREKLIGIILSGANLDGALGLRQVKKYNGLTIVQDPAESQINTMPNAAIEKTKVDYIYKTQEIINFLNKLEE